MSRGRYHYEAAEEYSGAYMVKGWRGVAWRVRGWQTEPDEDTEWSGDENRTGQLVIVMIGDDSQHLVDPEDVQKIERAEYCGECGQIGCSHDGYEREEA